MYELDSGATDHICSKSLEKTKYVSTYVTLGDGSYL